MKTSATSRELPLIPIYVTAATVIERISLWVAIKHSSLDYNWVNAKNLHSNVVVSQCTEANQTGPFICALSLEAQVYANSSKIIYEISFFALISTIWINVS